MTAACEAVTAACDTCTPPSHSHPLLADKEARSTLRNHLLSIAVHPWPEVGWDPAERDVILGLLASDARLAVRALRDWTHAMDLPYVNPQVSCPQLPW